MEEELTFYSACFLGLSLLPKKKQNQIEMDDAKAHPTAGGRGWTAALWTFHMDTPKSGGATPGYILMTHFRNKLSFLRRDWIRKAVIQKQLHTNSGTSSMASRTPGVPGCVRGKLEP